MRITTYDRRIDEISSVIRRPFVREIRINNRTVQPISKKKKKKRNTRAIVMLVGP